MRHFLGYGNAVPLKLLSGRFIFWKSLKGVGRLGLPDPNTIGLTFQRLSQYNSSFRAASVNLFSGHDTLLQILTQATMVGRDL